MAFTFRPSDDTEKILSEYMEKQNIRDKSKCLSFLINSRPAIDKELAEKRKETNKIVSAISKENERLQTELNRVTALLISEQTNLMFDSLIKNLQGNQKEIQAWRKKQNK